MEISRRLLRLSPGLYFYVGSAKSSGGALARIIRHISLTKRIRWHVDYLTTSKSSNILGFYLINSRCPDCEKEIFKTLINKYNYIPDFGSTDKPGDLSHLFMCNKTNTECIAEVYSILEQSECILEQVYVDISGSNNIEGKV